MTTAYFKHPTSGAIVVCNAGAWTGVYNNPSVLETPQWTAQPGFISPPQNKIGTIVTLDFGTVSPEQSIVSARIGTSAITAPSATASDFTGPFIGNGGTIQAEWVGKQIVAEFTATNGREVTTLYIPSFVVVEADDEEQFPADIPAGDWSAEEYREGTVSGRRRFTMSVSAPAPVGFESRWYSGPTSGGVGNDGSTTRVVPGDNRLTNGQMVVGQVCHNVIFWKRLSDGAYQLAHPIEEQISFEILGLDLTDPGDPDDPTFPPANQTVSSTAGLLAAIDARISSGSTATWIVDLNDGDYGSVSIFDKNLPGEFIIRSNSRTTLGAKMRLVRLRNSRNIHFQFIDFNRQSFGFTDRIVEVLTCQKIGFSYNRWYAPAIVADSVSGKGYLNNARTGLYIYKAPNQAGCTDILVHMNLFEGPIGQQIYSGGTDGLTLSDNVSVNTGADFFICGTTKRTRFLRNWGSRMHYPTYDPNARGGLGDYYHSDNLQIDSWAGTSSDVQFIGNVFIAGKHGGTTGITRQGIFASKSTGVDFVYRNNLMIVNSLQGLWFGPSLTNGVIENNTVLRIIDMPSGHKKTTISVQGSNLSFARNMHMGDNGWAGVRNLKPIGDDFTASLVYYENAHAEVGGAMSSFYDCRPKAGTLAHWGYSGGPAEGPAERFREVIVDKKYPKIGPAATAWNTWYDPKNQIA